MFRSLFKLLALIAGVSLLAIGLAIAQSPPVPLPTPAAPNIEVPAAPPVVVGDRRARNHAMRQTCRAEISKDLKGKDRRAAMKTCTEAKRQAAGMLSRAERQARRAKAQEARQACRIDIGKGKRGEARREAMQACLAKTDPLEAKAMACQKDARDKNLTRRTPEFRAAIRECMAKN